MKRIGKKRKIWIALLSAILLIWCVGLILPFNKAPKGNDVVMLLSKSDMPIKLKNSGADFLMKVGIKEWPVGHTGNLIIESDGTMTLYEFGRFSTGIYGCKSVNGVGACRKLSLGNVKNIKGSKTDGKYNYDVILDHIASSGKWLGKGCIDAVVNEHADASLCKKWWKTLAFEKTRDAYHFMGNNCASAAQRGFESTLYKYVKSGLHHDNNWLPCICEGQTFKYWANVDTKRVSSNVDQQFAVNDVLGALNVIFPVFSGVLSSDYSWLNIFFIL